GLEAVHAGHQVVHEDHVRARLPQIFQGMLRALGGVHLQPVSFQHAAENHAGRARIVDDQGSLGHSARDDSRQGHYRQRGAAPRSMLGTNTARAGGMTSMAYSTADIRNIALVGQAGAGKTLLAESLLTESGAVRSRGSLERGTTVCDFDPQEQEVRHSLDAALVHVDVGPCRVNRMENPG